jgi:hypothetical protein
MEIKPGAKIPKPVITQEECDAYSAVVDAITAHNAAAAVGETLWSMDDQPGAYVVVEAGTQPDPADAPKPTPTLEERLVALDKLPETLEALKNENEMLKQCLLEMSETVYA